MIWTIEKGCVIASNGNVVKFQFPIRETAIIHDVLIVILDVPADRMMTENVFGLSSEGIIIWQVAPTVANSTDPANRYMDIMNYGQNRVEIGNWNGMNAWVDIHTGQVLSEGFAK